MAAGGTQTPSIIQYLGNDNNDGLVIGRAITTKLAFYGDTPAAQRASSNQATTNIAVSASFGATQLAVVQEIMNTLDVLGLWKGAA